MKAILFIVLTIAAFFQAQISPNDFRPLFGRWKGDLTYNDYSSGKLTKIPVEVSVSELPADKNAVMLRYVYPKEPQANENDTLRISSNGKMLNDKTVVSVAKENNTVILTTEKQGMDNNKPASLKYIYTISDSKFNIRKEVKYNDDKDYFFRNEYVLTR